MCCGGGIGLVLLLRDLLYQRILKICEAESCKLAGYTFALCLLRQFTAGWNGYFVTFYPGEDSHHSIECEYLFVMQILQLEGIILVLTDVALIRINVNWDINEMDYLGIIFMYTFL